MLYNISFNQN